MGRWGNTRDLGSLFDRPPDYIEASAIHDASVFCERGFTEGDANPLGALEIIFLSLQALRDPDVVIRSRAFRVLRLTTLNLLDDAMEAAQENGEEGSENGEEGSSEGSSNGASNGASKPKISVNPQETEAAAPREIGSFRAPKGTSIKNL